jgi:DNA ligase-1
MELARLVKTSLEVAATRSRNRKRDLLVACIEALAPGEVGIGVSYLAGRLPQGRVGVGPAALRKAAQVDPAETPHLAVVEVVSAVDEIAATGGRGSGAERTRRLAALFSAATTDEQRFLVMLLLGELRQGALDGVMVEALAKASGCAASDVRRAFMLSGDLGRVAVAAQREGPPGLARFRLELGTPIQSMLAQTAHTIEDAVSALQRVVLDTKMDGARVQVHKRGGEVAVFSRRLHDVSASVPEVVEVVRGLPVDSALLDGEAIALDSTGRPHPFQTTMRRFGRKLEVAAARNRLPLSVFFFDCLHAEGEDLIERPLTERLAALDEFAASYAMPRLETEDPGAAADFLAAAIAAGHEGVMAKAPESPYGAGSRGSAWLKVKPTYTLDLVILAAEWGHGRRKGWLSNLHLGARDEAVGHYVMLGKTFKGLSDAMLKWQTERLLELEVARDGHVVFVEPRVVVEVAFNEVQTSSQYPGGLALRFARVKAYREDKGPEDADIFESVREIHARSHRI